MAKAKAKVWRHPPLPRATKANLKKYLPELVPLAKKIKDARSHEEVDAVLDEANKLLDAYGIEAIECNRQVDRYYFDINLLYVNTGDTYNTTLMYDTYEGRFYVTTMGDWVERAERRHGDGFCR